jgi:hypothetical protein
LRLSPDAVLLGDDEWQNVRGRIGVSPGGRTIPGDVHEIAPIALSPEGLAFGSAVTPAMAWAGAQTPRC